MNLSKTLRMTGYRWHGLALSLVLVAMAHLTAVSRNEPWPVLLSNEAAQVDGGIARLQQRASGSLERLMQSTAAQQTL